MDLIDYNEFLIREEQGLITIRKHPFLDLEILNYTAKTQYKRSWDDYTLVCRGLILDSEHNIISKPFQKFFNLNEVSGTTIANLPNEIPSITEKLDGSLGILFPENDKCAITSRGSFESDYSIWATNWIREKGYTFDDFKPNYTYCFEMIYPDSKIVVDYKGRSELVLLAVISNKSKDELNHVREAEELGFSYAKEYHFNSLIEAEKYLSTTNGMEQEGFVCKYSNGLRLKLKSDDYKRLHKILTGFSEHNIWEALQQGKSLDSLLEIVPDEFYQWVKKVESELKEQHNMIIQEADTIAYVAKKLSTRKDQAHHILRMTAKRDKRLSSVIFALLDEKWEQAHKTAWDIVEPK